VLQDKSVACPIARDYQGFTRFQSVQKCSLLLIVQACVSGHGPPQWYVSPHLKAGLGEETNDESKCFHSEHRSIVVKHMIP
jgi:hypothetical protein